MKIAKGRITLRKSGNRGYNSVWIYVPSKLVKDSSFPFEEKSEVIIEIDDEKLIIRKSYELSDIIKKYGIEDATLPKLLEKKALINDNRPFLYFNDKCFSYHDLNKNTNQIAHGLISLIKNLKLKKPKISLLLPNCPEYIFCWFGVIKAGCIFVPVSQFLKGNLLKFILQNSDTEILIIEYEYFNDFKEFIINLPKIKKIIIRNAPSDFKYNDRYTDFQELYSSNSENPDVIIKNWHPMEIIYTQGTTGKPKGVVYRNYYVLSGISMGSELEEIGFNQSHKIFCPLPLFLGFVQFWTIIPAIFYNASVIITEKFDVSTFWDKINSCNATVICYFRKNLSMLINQQPKKADRKHSVKYAFGCGATKKIWDTFEKRFGIPIYECWGLVEGIGMTFNKLGSKGGKKGSIGKPVSGYELKIVDIEGNELPPGPHNIGEIVSRTKLPFELEYNKIPGKIIPTKVGKNRWVYTGDYGYTDNDGYVYFLGRKEDMIEYNSEVFFATDIEKVVNAHPYILESAAFTVPSEKNIKLCVVKRKDSEITHKELSNYLFENLAYFMVPRFIEFKRELPKNSNELISKYILRKEWEEEITKRNIWDTQFNKFIIPNQIH